MLLRGEWRKRGLPPNIIPSHTIMVCNDFPLIPQLFNNFRSSAHCWFHGSFDIPDKTLFWQRFCLYKEVDFWVIFAYGDWFNADNLLEYLCVWFGHKFRCCNCEFLVVKKLKSILNFSVTLLRPGYCSSWIPVSWKCLYNRSDFRRFLCAQLHQMPNDRLLNKEFVQWMKPKL